MTVPEKRAGLVAWLVVLVAALISLVIAWEQVFPLAAALGVLAQFLAVMLALAGSWSLRRGAAVAGFILLFTWTVEYFGANTGFPFGRYAYTAALQPQVGGVPLLIPLAWLMMLPPAWAVSQALLGGLRLPEHRNGILYRLLFAALAGLVFTAWDLYLDPQMVARGSWVWGSTPEFTQAEITQAEITQGGYFGIPWANYLGWWVVSSVLTFVVAAFTPVPLLQSSSRQLLALIYGLTWIVQALVLGLFWGQPGPALAGFLGMGVFFVGAVWLERTAWLAGWQALIGHWEQGREP